MSNLSSLLEISTINTITNYIEPGGPLNFKIKYTSNTNFSNTSIYMQRSQFLILSGSSQKAQPIGRIGGTTQFGNGYLGQPVNINYLGRGEGQPGGSGAPPRNRF
jgi:hypothetical protein